MLDSLFVVIVSYHDFFSARVGFFQRFLGMRLAG